MTTGLLVQYLVVGVVVAISVLALFRKLAPRLANRWLAAASARLDRPGRSRFARALARRLQPKQATGNCADGCSTCGACGPKPAATVRGDAQPLTFRPKSGRP